MDGFDRFWNGTCGETRARLSDHLDGALHGARGWRVRRHLVRCERCRAVLDSLIALVEQLRAFGRVEPAPAPSAVDAVIARIEHEAR